jgi:hypothetical protein
VNSLKAVAEEWLDKARREGRADVTVGKLTWPFEFAYPIIGDRKVGLSVISCVGGRLNITPPWP